ncbi:hypothetical protein M413DRAFT_440266 [Hebeloma cylindrosporum]|uniref:Nephrocystin 3-like N-terminal domain-containing protein n=1 Tax=Hebeloma cylindrosporum TaxID=76867 RepID=A0A0C3CS23_HEBCY|nr:hypothetical protein M413DRAFT_440266 [Hebeloma cylindrosporum h7]
MDEASNSQDNGRPLNIFGGNFTDVKGDVHHYHIRGNFVKHEPELGRGIDKLSQVVSLSAIHDSSERYPPPRCHPETRTLVRSVIICWIEDPNPTSFVLWLYGPAGAGKSAILQSLAEECYSLEGCFGGSFFFSRGKPGRNQGHFLFSTIAYQLAMNLPYLRTHIDSAMQADPSLYTKSMMVQMRFLIIDSFRKISETIEHIPTVIVDGLDECDGHETQRVILEIIYEAVAIHKLPLRFLIASRPEAHIREAFDRPTLRSITKRLVLDESFGPNLDIEKYLRDGFDTIYEQNPTLMEQVVQPWPGPGVLDLLVQKASGQFIYASTVLKFVGAEFYNPISQLDIVLEPSPSNKTLFSDLDHLYSQILSTYPIPERLISVLGILLALQYPQPPGVIEDLLGMKAGEVGLVLRGLHSLIKFSHIPGEYFNRSTDIGEDNGIRLLHASFEDYLVDRSRSGHFFIDRSLFRTQITRAGFQLMTKWISQPSGLDTTRCPFPETWGYLKWHLSPHFWESSEELRDEVFQLLLAHAEYFWANRPNSDTVFEPLHCAMTALAHMMFTKRKTGWQGILGNAHDRTVKQIEDEFPEDHYKKFDERMAIVFYKYRDILDASYHLWLSESRALEELIQFAPGFLVMRQFMTIRDAATLLDVNETLFLDLLERVRPFVNFLLSNVSAGVRFNVHARDFLCDKTRSMGHYHNPRFHHFSICLKDYKLTFESDSETLPEVSGYLTQRLAEHLRASDVEPSENILPDHPIWPFLDYLCQIVYYLPAFDSDPSLEKIRAVWFVISTTLQWVQGQQELIGLSNVHHKLQYKLCALADRIYNQILCLDGSNGKAIVTICPPILAAIEYGICINHARSSRSGLEPVFQIPVLEPYEFDDPCNARATGVSHNLLLLESLNLSLTEYLTNRTRSNNLYVDADTYHTQMAELCLDRCVGPEGDREKDAVEIKKGLYAGEHWKFHLVRARPSQRIFARLGVLSSWSFIGVSHRHSDSFRAIITWLEGLPAPPLKVYLRYQKILLTIEEQEGREAGDAIDPSMQASLLAEAQQLPPPIVTPDRASSQSSVTNILGYLQDYVAVFIGWLLNS